MSKITKFFRNPVAFMQDAAINRSKSELLPTYVVGFSTWKQYLRKFFPERDLIFLPREIGQSEFDSLYRKKILSRPDAEIFIWGFKAPQFVLDFIKTNGTKAMFVEDGFVRSVQLGATKSPPMSLCLDSRTPYFNARESSDLEVLLSEYDFAADPVLLERAKAAIQMLLDTGISKYNNASPVNIERLYGLKNGKRILVIGQVEDDASIEFGCEQRFNNSDVVRLAVQENPGAQVIYKPHPDVLNGHRPSQSNPREVAHLCQVLDQDVPLFQAFERIDQVYTIASLAGFEALLRGIKVTTLGCPFYSGWGLTDDRQANARRTRQLSLPELFAGSYLLYAKYFDTETGERTTLEYVIRQLVVDAAAAKAKPAAKAVVKTKPAAKAVVKAKPAAKAVVKAKPAAKAVVKAKPAAKPAAKPVPKAAAPAARANVSDIPAWFQSGMGPELSAAIAGDAAVFLYIPWIAEHGNVLVSRIAGGNDYVMAPLDLAKDVEDNDVRRDVARYAREYPHIYRRMVARRLAPLRNRISGLVFTFDWAPVMRIIASVCEELEIPRILIPHESVFVDRNKYYWDPTANASMPVADLILGWGSLQRDIFVERGYPADRFISVGAPKFDAYSNYQPQLSRRQFCRFFGLEPNRKTILFASQPLDSQLNATVARASQRQAISDLLDCAEEKGFQLLVRLPPSKDNILGAPLRKRLDESLQAAIDDALCYVVSPEEALYHADLVTSVNSTMLFEGLLLGRPALSMKYVEFEQIWEQAGIPAVRNREELFAQIDHMLSGSWEASVEGRAWAAEMFSNGAFDGKACERIVAQLKAIVAGQRSVSIRPSALDRLFISADNSLDVIANPSVGVALETSQRYLLPMLNARSRVSSRLGLADLKSLASVDIFVQWGITPNAVKTRQREAARALGRPYIIVEDGFIRSVDIGLSGEPGLSVILDDTTAYYDATKPSRLQRLLESGPDLTAEQFERCQRAIAKIVESRVSKYNHAPNLALTIGVPGRKKVLLIDQRFGDQSVASGLADENSFQRMLNDALRLHPDCDIIIKQHPDAIKGGKSSYFSNERLAFSRYMDNLHLINFDVNPYALLDLVDVVFVVTSGMGFEALMAGKVVHCYGAPFYSNMGVTLDQVQVSGRSRRRSVEELFHFAYIDSSRYFHPEQNKTVQVEELVDYIIEKRKW